MDRSTTILALLFSLITTLTAALLRTEMEGFTWTTKSYYGAAIVLFLTLVYKGYQWMRKGRGAD